MAAVWVADVSAVRVIVCMYIHTIIHVQSMGSCDEYVGSPNISIRDSRVLRLGSCTKRNIEGLQK